MQDVKLQSYLTSALGGSEWSDSLPGHFTAGVRATGTRWICSWVGLRPIVEVLEEKKNLSVRKTKDNSAVVQPGA